MSMSVVGATRAVTTTAVPCGLVRRSRAAHFVPPVVGAGAGAPAAATGVLAFIHVSWTSWSSTKMRPGISAWPMPQISVH
jgi:hypothetical protein